ncbi:hemerythrin domain-containing protein [Geomonas sp. Red69]|uniref:hemerythrin domain-containing protein n=1 Tax=Geomonas diazotrophica TaxID=2843197 RepID=UPI001C11FBCB|nr:MULTISPECIES: hemerythrin domain-containing protein [Geomonas]MBU5635432.1 hemerythrin domain-containing protein [Geomonas diazotrophica]QXE86655.1 hemerythrin domain-containing protein [Geomonas nitrogeniifigens]
MPTGQKSSESQSRAEMTIFDLLKQDHEKARYLFDKAEKAGKKEISSLQKLFSQLEEELELHMEGEERFFYSALEQNEEIRDKVLQAFEEHQVAKAMLGTFQSLAVDDERWVAKLKVLGEIVEHHMQEEEKEVFKMARKALGKEQQHEIALAFQRSKREGRKSSRGAPVEG